MTIYIHILWLMFPAQVTNDSCCYHFIWGGHGLAEWEYGSRRSRGEGTCWIGGGRPKAFLKKKEMKEDFLKNMWLSGDTEILPCRGFILPQTIYNGMYLNSPSSLHLDIIILRANTEKCLINILLSNTLSKSDPCLANLFLHRKLFTLN